MAAAPHAMEVPSVSTPCIEWWGRIDPHSGYGSSGKLRAHRMIYAECFGPIERGLVIDHLCRNKRCVNPEHLEAVTQRVNVLRGTGPVAQRARKPHCKRGHEFTPENTLIRQGRCRQCRTCVNAALAMKRREKGIMPHPTRVQIKQRPRKRIEDLL